jgi:nucleoside-diphosphate-sugar epimerase
MQRRALITGATGFVGSHLAERLAVDGWRIRALVRPTSDASRLEALGAELCEGSLGDRDSLRRASAGAEVVFHLAAVTGLRAERDFERANVEGTRNVVEAVRGAEPRPRRVVYLSSYAACGPSEPGRPRRVDDAPAPLTAYGRTKLAGERIVRELEGEVETVVVRAPAVYGPGDHAFLAYFRLVRLGLAPAPAGGEQELHLIYAPDLARALARAADVRPGTRAIAEPGVHTWADVVREIARAMGRRPVRVPLPPAVVRAAAAITEASGRAVGRAVVFNREKAEEMLARSWVCDLTGSEALLTAGEATPLGEGISQTVRWYRRQGWL